MVDISILNPPLKNKVISLLEDGKKADAVVLVQKVLQCGLVNAKQLVDELEKELKW